jgi:hypothetical protein
VIEFERIVPGHGARPYTVSVADIMSLEPADDERTRLRIRDHGEVLASASYAKIKRLIVLVRSQMASALEAEP